MKQYVKVVEAFEKNHLRGEIGSCAEKTFDRVSNTETGLTPQARATRPPARNGGRSSGGPDPSPRQFQSLNRS